MFTQDHWFEDIYKDIFLSMFQIGEWRLLIAERYRLILKYINRHKGGV